MALAALDRGAMQIVLVVDSERHLLGVVTDGDIRKHILRGGSLDLPIAPLMNSRPVLAKATEPHGELLARMRDRTIHQLPLVDEEQRVVGLVTLDDLLAARVQPNLVVLMAGGVGSRLRPLTSDTPKPMLKVGERPILETIVLQFKDYGFRRFVIAMHYLGEQIADYFGDGSRFGAEITYLRETEPLGTAGALSLLGRPARGALLSDERRPSHETQFHKPDGLPPSEWRAGHDVRARTHADDPVWRDRDLRRPSRTGGREADYPAFGECRNLRLRSRGHRSCSTRSCKHDDRRRAAFD